MIAWRAYARYLSLSADPIILGPWRSEVGFEVLYWIPWLQQFRLRHQIDRNRLITIGRGGSAAWYDTAGTADLYEHVPVEVARTWSIRASQQTGSLKQHAVEPWERHVVGLTAASLGIRRYHTISPSWMYRLLSPFWSGQQPQRWLNEHLAHPIKLPAPALPADLKAKLPDRYLAVRWYARPTWPLTERLQLWMRTYTERLAQRCPVVVIDSFHADDHADIHLGPIPNVLRLSELHAMTPQDNLAIQSSVIAHAQAYVGTYGGMAQAAMRWHRPTLALYDTFGQTAPEHLAHTYDLSLRTGVPFVACTPKQADEALPMLLSGPAISGQKMPPVHRVETV